MVLYVMQALISMDWIFISSQNSWVKILTAKAIVFEGGAWDVIRLWGWSPNGWFKCLIKVVQEKFPLPCPPCEITKTTAMRKRPSTSATMLAFQSAECEKWVPVDSKPLGLWYFITVAWVDDGTYKKKATVAISIMDTVGYRKKIIRGKKGFCDNKQTQFIKDTYYSL
jgi:hypothetical protein